MRGQFPPPYRGKQIPLFSQGRIDVQKIIVGAVLTLDGVMHAPADSKRDTGGGFKWGGWQMPYHDVLAVVRRQPK